MGFCKSPFQSPCFQRWRDWIIIASAALIYGYIVSWHIHPFESGPSSEKNRLKKKKKKSNAFGNASFVSAILAAGVDSIDPKTLQRIPLWEDLEDLYGPGPHILGLETCQTFQQSIEPPQERHIGIAGLFNTNTNHVFDLLRLSCSMPYGPVGGPLWQVPWGKHSFPEQRFDNWIDPPPAHAKNLTVEKVLPVVMVRDPYFWMQAMCRHPYQVVFTHQKHCPNLMKEDSDGKQRPNSVMIEYSNTFVKRLDSLAHLWTAFYAQYLDADFPRLIVRFEDVVFRPKETVEQICQCGGGTMKKQPFDYKTASVKGERDAVATDWVGAVAKYGTFEHRYDGFRQEDLDMAKRGLDSKLMELLHYQEGK